MFDDFEAGEVFGADFFDCGGVEVFGEEDLAADFVFEFFFEVFFEVLLEFFVGKWAEEGSEFFGGGFGDDGFAQFFEAFFVFEAGFFEVENEGANVFDDVEWVFD